MTDRRAILASLSGILAGCRTTPEAQTVDLNNEGVQNALNALIESVELLQKTVGAFGTANCKDIAVQVKNAAADVNNNLTGLRQALGYPESN
jgi:hypothetical protein